MKNIKNDDVKTPEQEIIEPNGSISDQSKKTFWDRFIVPLGAVGVIGFWAYGLLQLAAGYTGIEHYWGSGWAMGFLFLALMLRITLPITIGSYFGAVDVWGWHWLAGLVFAAPGLALFFLFMAGSLFSRGR